MLEAILIKRENVGLHTFSFNQSVSHLLSLTSGIDKQTILDVHVYQRHFMRFIPWYKKSKGGGAITLGSDKTQSITFTENFFEIHPETDVNVFILNWLRLASHEVMHIVHARKYKHLIIYLWVFLIQYIRFGYKEAPNEKEANEGTFSFDRFNGYINRIFGYNMLSKLIHSNMSEDEKIKQINEWWKSYQLNLTINKSDQSTK